MSHVSNQTNRDELFPKCCGHYMVEFEDWEKDKAAWLRSREYNLELEGVAEMGVEIGGIVVEDEVMDALEFLSDDYIVRMPPVREYTVRAKIKSIEKGVPRFVEDECLGCRYGSCNTCPPLNVEFKDWDELSDEALETLLVEHGDKKLLAEFRLKAHVGGEALKDFEELVDQSAPPETFWDRLKYWTVDFWDWFMGR